MHSLVDEEDNSLTQVTLYRVEWPETNPTESSPPPVFLE